MREPNASVIAAWRRVYQDTETHWDLYELAESLMDIDDLFQTWRFRHANTVERVIGSKPGTGGTSGAAYLRRAVGIRLFEELWAVRTDL
jgi:tryptophan 2,3-dioxygenase